MSQTMMLPSRPPDTNTPATRNNTLVDHQYTVQSAASVLMFLHGPAMSSEPFTFTDKAQTSLKQLDAVVLTQASNDFSKFRVLYSYNKKITTSE